MKRHYVYETTNLINGKKYIGKRTCNCPIEEDKYIGSGKLLKKAIEKYGKENFKKEILQVCNSEEDAYKKEIELIHIYNAVDNEKYYNLSEGGHGFTSNEVKQLWKNEDYRKKISHARKKLWENPQHRKHMKEIMSGANSYFYGKQRTNEEKEKISKIHTGNKYNLGRKHTEETKIKIREKNKGRTYGIDVRKKVSNATKRLWENPQHRNYMKKKLSGANNYGAKQVICLNTMEIFETITYASDKTGIYLTGICRCCKGKRKSAGKINGEPAKWMYYEDYLRQNSNS